ncbi:MAG: hypothetical protein EP343_31165 [Deltaproteobacteria bacterium]|nr:MAG: hypothetical protein EP343_31165 [Deltaproteobacteria bacterium]
MLLVQLMLGWSTLMPMNADVAPPRPVAVSRPAKAAMKPVARPRTQAPTPAKGQTAPTPARRAQAAPVKPAARTAKQPSERKAAPAARRPAAKQPVKAGAAPAARPKPAPRKEADSPKPSADFLSQLPYQPDSQVVVNKLPNGMLTWCKSQEAWKVVEVRFAVAAGSANDPKGLYGRSRFLAELLRKKLNQPKNPARSILPEGGQRYHVTLGKDWVEVRVRSTPKQLPDVLKHLTQSLQSFASTKITKDMRDSLSKTSRTFPPPSLRERVDAYLFGGQPRGALLRGKKRTYRTIQPFALRSTYETLYSGNRMRLLLVGGLDCKATTSTLASTLGKLSRGKDEPLFVNSVPSGSGKSRPLVSAQEIVMVYQLPDLFRHSYLPLVLLRDVAVREVQFQIQKKYGVTVKVHSYLKPSAKGGYLVLIAPTQPLARKQQTQLLKKALGWLQMKSYSPALEQRVHLYLQEIQLGLSQKLESSHGTAEVLWPQLLLPEPPQQKASQAPAQVTPVLESVKPKSLRELALIFMNKDLSVARAMRPFSLRRIALFVGTIILIWLLLDIFLRRTRREE